MSTAIGVSLPRLATAVGKAISEYAVLGKTPGFTADFIKNKYPGKANFASAIIHARSGNAVMTDGYGPELVTNGGFDSDSDWTKGTGWSIADGKAVKTAGTASNLQQNSVLTSGKTYVVEFTVSNRTAGQCRVFAASGGAGTFRNSNGTFSEILTATGANFWIYADSSFNGSIDNVSVREMPVLKWGPHNQFPESEDASAWSLTGLTATTNATTAPDGTTTADLLTVNNGASSALATNATDTGDVFAFWVKNNGADFLSVYFSGYSGRAWVDLSDFTAGSETGSVSIKGITSAGNDWYLIEFQKQDNSSRPPVITLTDANNGGTVTGDGVKGIYVWGVHLYRSDLGGMVDNPDQPASRASYVPTTSSAKYLPRIGHHVYNGSAWVNEGLLAESESRTNLTAESIPNNTWTEIQANITENETVSPDGNENASKVAETATTSNHFVFYEASNISYVSGTTYTQSAILKKGTREFVQLVGTSAVFGANAFANFDLSDGSVGTVGSGVSLTTVQDLGNGWYRCSMTADAINTVTGNNDLIMSVTSKTATRAESFAGSTSNYFYVYHAQTEAASTPSSLIPTSGSTVTRPAETFTIPSANLPWSQSYGTEVSASSWTGSGWDTFTSTGDDFSANKSTGGGTDHAYSDTAVTVVSGQSVKIDVDFDTGTNTQATIGLSSTTNGRSNFVTVDPSAGGTKSVTVTATQSGTFSISVRTTLTGTINVTGATAAVATNDPVSIAMDGRMTYADTSSSEEVFPFQWLAGGSNYIRNRVRTTGFRTGQLYFSQRESSSGLDEVITLSTHFNPDILVPYSLTGRYGSTFINGAESGVALTANTDPTVLPDLSSTDLDLAYKYMGTIGTFRVWDKDLGDDGIVEATNPSLEPSLSLTFEGTGTNSFVVNNWSN